MKRKLNYKFNYRKLVTVILVLVVIIIGIITSFKGKRGDFFKDIDTEIINEESKENSIDENETIENDNKSELTDENKTSFGKLEVPVYKKDEKDIKIPIIIYHAFSTPLPAEDKYKLFSTRERFEDNVTTLLNAGYTFITLDDVYKYNNGEIGLPEKNVLITMDDGWVGNYTDAFPVLKEYNVPATIFVVEELIGTQGYFSWEQAREMYNTGLVKIHSHGQKHIDHSKLSKEALLESVNHSQETIQKELGAKVSKIFAYPAGAYSENSVKWLKEAGYEIQVLTKYGTVNKSINLDLTSLGRIRGEQASGASLLKTIENAKTK